MINFGMVSVSVHDPILFISQREPYRVPTPLLATDPMDVVPDDVGHFILPVFLSGHLRS